MRLARLNWRWAVLSGLLVFAALIALAWHLHEPPVTARPALWRISQGDRHGWLFGTIHAAPAGARWLSPKIEVAARESDVLVLEATGLAEERNDRQIFDTVGRSPNLPPVAARLGTANRPRLAVLIKASPAALRDLDAYESWAAALLIGAAVNGGTGASSDQAGEARFERLFGANGRPVLGLETISDQLGLFDKLPQEDQDVLLTQAVEEATDTPRLFTQLYARWAAGDLPALEAQFLQPLARYPHLRVALIDRRNALWAQRIDKLLRENGKTPFIALGAGHLIGAGSVENRLADLGWKIERIQ